MTAPNPRTDAQWQRCPVCNGRRVVDHGFFSGITGGTSTTPDKCLVCNGSGLVPFPDYGQADFNGAAAPLLERVTQSLRALLPHAGVGFMAMGDNEHREYVKARADARAVLAEVDALEAHDGADGD